VIRKLAEADKLLAEGKTVEEACRHLEITESTYHRLIRASSGALY
jgi:transposase